MTYSDFQQRIYENKVRRGFNVTDVEHEIVLMTEEFGELNDAYIHKLNSEPGPQREISYEKMVDAIGDLQVYNLGLASMFGWKADEVVNRKLELPLSGSFDDYTFPETDELVDDELTDNGLDTIVTKREIPRPIQDYFPYVSRWLGKFANAYKKSNKELVDKIDRREEFHTALGNLIGYCSKMFEVLKADEFSVLEQIVKNNETRTHEGQI